MAEKGKQNASHHRQSSRPTSAQLSLRTKDNNKKQRVSLLMDLSSRTNTVDRGNTVSTSKNDTPKNTQNTSNEVQEIREVVKNLTTVMVKYIPNCSTTLTSTGLPLLISTETRPTKSTMSKGKETEIIMSKLHKSSESPSKSKPRLKNEVLVKYRYFMGDRDRLQSLMPTKHVHQDVINMLVYRLTYTEKLVGPETTCWYLPSMFAKYALDKVTSPKTLMDMYRPHFMGKVELVRKIFVPIHDDSTHWYLLVVDLDEHKLILLDSKKCAFRSEWRRLQVRKVAVFLQEMLMNNSFYAFSHLEKPEVGGFELIEPKGIEHEVPGSYDSGVWVANWMLDYDWDDDYDKLTVRTSRIITTASRMRLALDLVLHGYNDLRELIIKKATNNWTTYANQQQKIMHSVFE
ncbi:Ulp1 protease family, C-terminal catalytic domain [Sesbania bispinosa]|nr:Ulp1 protease family, C-terminal catalytic domain [Sesbania bispinosa]